MTLGSICGKDYAGVVTVKQTLFSKRVLFAKITVVGCVLAAIIDGELCAFVGEAAWDISSLLVIRQGPAAGRAELLRLVGAA